MTEKVTFKVTLPTRPAIQRGDAALKNHACNVCAKLFGSQDALRSHVRAKHQVRCSVCSKGFIDQQAVLQHSRVHNRIAITDKTSITSWKKVTVTEKELKREDNIPTPRSRPIVIDDDVITAESSSAVRKDTTWLQGQNQVQNQVQPDRFLYRNNAYSLLQPNEQAIVYSRLLSLCHTAEVLRVNHYTLPGRGELKSNTSIPYSEFRTSHPATNQWKRRVVAIDCEMVGLWTNKDSVALICAIDVLSGECILYTYVDPQSRVKAWRTRVSGVSASIMSTAARQHQVVAGWRAARQALWNYIDADTILVGHSLHHDLNVLGIFPTRVIDTAILTANTVFPEILETKAPRSYGLKTLMSDLLGMTVQIGKQSHDCLEDTLATRELALWCVRNPSLLNQWGLLAREIFELRKAEIQLANELAREKARNEAGKASEVSNSPRGHTLSHGESNSLILASLASESFEDESSDDSLGHGLSLI